VAPQLVDFPCSLACILLVLNEDGHSHEPGGLGSLEVLLEFSLFCSSGLTHESNAELGVTKEFKFSFKHIDFLEGGIILFSKFLHILRYHSLHNIVGLYKF
jgi:hypothetical protein